MNKLLKNIFASALPQIMNIVTNLILPSLIIVKYGSEINGLVSSTKAIVSYISIVGAGIATATTQSLYRPVVMKDTDSIKGMLHASNMMFNKYGIIYCIIAFFVAVIFPFSLKTEIKYSTTVFLVLAMSISGASEFFAIGRCRSFLYANQKTYVCTITQAISIACGLLMALVIINTNASIVFLQFAISFAYVVRALFLVLYIKKNHPELSDYKKSKPIKAATEKRNDAMIHQLSGLAVNCSQTMILTWIMGLQAASIYSVYNMVFSGLQSICSNLSVAVTPFLGKELALKNIQKTREMYDLVELAFFNLVAFVYAVTIVMIVPFVSIYTRKSDIGYVYSNFAIIFSFASAFYILKLPSNSLINVSGLFKETRWRAIIEGCLTVVLGTAFTAIWGLEGVVLGTAIALCWRCVDTIVYTNKHVLNCGNFRSLFRLARVIVILLVMTIVESQVSLKATTYFLWIKEACILSAVVIVVLIINALIFDFKTLTTVDALIKKKRCEKN